MARRLRWPTPPIQTASRSLKPDLRVPATDGSYMVCVAKSITPVFSYNDSLQAELYVGQN